MRPFVPSSPRLPTPSLTFLPPPHSLRNRRLRSFLPAPLAASSSSRRPYRRRRDAPSRTPPPSFQQQPQQHQPPRTPPQPQQQRAANAAARGQEDLEEAIYDFMCRSAKPGAFPTREELVAAGRADLAAAVASSGGWLSLGWSPTGAGGAAPRSSGGGHPDYPPETGVYHHRDSLARGSGEDSTEW
jgi:hypothetical protein